jgi:phage terminase small subunit
MRPTSDASKQSSGTYKHTRQRTPLATPIGRPEQPAWLQQRAREEWDRVVPALEMTGCLSTIDATMLAMYATLTAELAEDPKEFTAAKYTQLRLICGELGLSISSRLKLRQPERAAPPAETCKPSTGGKVVSISSLLSGTPKASSVEQSKPATMSTKPASDS